MPHDPADTTSESQRALTARVLDRCRDLGFAAAGVCTPEPSAYAAEFRAWLDANKHAGMRWLQDHAEVKLDPTRLLQGARSIVMVADLYAARDDEPDVHALAADAKVARYARGGDYHKVIKKRLHTLTDELRAAHPRDTFRAFTDTAPVMERELAARAGLGWTGKHTLTIHPRLGSYTLLGGFATTLDLVPNAEPVTDHCGSCTRCIDACPTDAITPYSVDASRCISYLTIEHREPIAPEFHAPIGDWIFGCDICQEVCPHNTPKPTEWITEDPSVLNPSPNPAYTPRNTSLDPLAVLDWTEDDRRQAFTKSAMKRATLAMMKRNAIINATNTALKTNKAAEITKLRERLTALLQDEDDLVRATAQQSLSRFPQA